MKNLWVFGYKLFQNTTFNFTTLYYYNIPARNNNYYYNIRIIICTCIRVAGRDIENNGLSWV